MDPQRDQKRQKLEWPRCEQPSGPRTDSSQVLTHLVKHTMDPLLSAALSRMHHELSSLREQMTAIQESLDEVKQSIMLEFEIESEEEDESDDGEEGEEGDAMDEEESNTS